MSAELVAPDQRTRGRILATVKNLVLRHHINVGGADYTAWLRLVDERTPSLLQGDAQTFENGVREILAELRSSHTGFYHDLPNGLLPQHTVNATLRAFEVARSPAWAFLDVFRDGPAHIAGIQPGDILLAVDDIACTPPAIPSFQVGQTHQLSITRLGHAGTRTLKVAVPYRKGNAERPPIVEPRSIFHTVIKPRTGLLVIPYFSGSLGLQFMRELDAAVRDLKQQGCERLIVDLRGNIGGSLGFARLASYLCAGRIPIGHSLTPRRLREGYNPDVLPREPMPASRAGLLLALVRYAARDKSLMLLTQGLGPQPFHGRVAVLVNEWTNSAAEMAASFASESRVATLVGSKTAGNVLGARNFRVGGGYWVRLPVFGWYTATGKSLEGNGVSPDVTVDSSLEALTAGQDEPLARALELLDGT